MRVESAVDNRRLVVSATPSVTTRDCAAWKIPALVTTPTVYVAGAIAENTNPPPARVLAVKANLPDASERMTVTPAIGVPELSRSTPDQEDSGGTAKLPLQRQRRIAATELLIKGSHSTARAPT